MAETALLVCDVQNDLVDPKGKVGAGGLAKIVADRDLLANLKKVIATARAKGWPLSMSGSDIARIIGTFSVLRRGSRRRERTRSLFAGNGALSFIPRSRLKPGTLSFTSSGSIRFLGRRCLNGCAVMAWPIFSSRAPPRTSCPKVRRVVQTMPGSRCRSSRTAARAPNPAWHEFSVTQMLPVFGRVVASSDIN